MKPLIIFSLCFILIYPDARSQSRIQDRYDLMPWPEQIQEKPQADFIIDESLTVGIYGGDNDRVFKAATAFLRRLSGRTGVFIDKGFPENAAEGMYYSVLLKFNSTAVPAIDTDESYILDINSKGISIEAGTDIGLLRGLETLLQLLKHNETAYYFPGITIHDAPRFVWRGLMIDAARHFMPVDVIKRNLRAMAAVKLNVFHWHLSDDQGFRVESKVLPKLHKLASDGEYYTHEQIREVVDYASGLGIRVIPEFDVPGHATAILTAYPELGSKPGYEYQIERFAGVFDPTLDPTNEMTYEFLDKLFSEMAPLFPDEYFHIGGDENEGKHWDENKSIQQFKKDHGLKSNHDLQTYFNIRLEKILLRLGKKLMGWDEIMTPGMPKTAIIHSWRGEHEGLGKGGTLIKAAKEGYNTVLSNGFYIDRMQPVRDHYEFTIIGDAELTPEEQARILGGEATMWGELVTWLTVDSRIWPRMAAIAERFWSPREVKDFDNMMKRLSPVSFRLEELGVMHIRNRDVILRNMAGNEDITALAELSSICEPLKIYTRNKGGTEYSSYSPFTLFADACTADAPDAIRFKAAVSGFIANSNSADKAAIHTYLEKWSENYSKFSELTKTPVLMTVESLSKSLSEVSARLLKFMKEQHPTVKEYAQIRSDIEKLSEPVADVEVVIVDDMKMLLEYYRKQ